MDEKSARKTFKKQLESLKIHLKQKKNYSKLSEKMAW